ncbi:AI-2E family transporter [Endothiovibrio diazotrophicus]
MSGNRPWWLLAAAVLGGWLLYLLAPILTPFVAGALLGYLGDPLADRLEARGLPRGAAVSVVFVVFSLLLLAVLLLLVPMLERQLSALVAKLPGWLEWLRQQLLPWLHSRFGVGPEVLGLDALKQSLAEHWKSAGGLLAGVAGSVTRSGVALASALANLLLIPIVGFYLLRDWDHLMENLRALLPRAWEPLVVGIARESDEVLGAFLRGQVLVMAALATIYSVGLALVGLELALLIGMVAGLVSFVPYLGFIVGIAAAGVAIFMQTHALGDLLWVALVFGVAQVVEGALLTPWLVGDRIGLHPVAVIFAVLAGGQLFGFFGVLLALPVAAVVAVILRHLHRNYVNSLFYTSSADDQP